MTRVGGYVDGTDWTADTDLAVKTSKYDPLTGKQELEYLLSVNYGTGEGYRRTGNVSIPGNAFIGGLTTEYVNNAIRRWIKYMTLPGVK